MKINEINIGGNGNGNGNGSSKTTTNYELQPEEIEELFRVIAYNEHNIRNSIGNRLKNTIAKGATRAKSTIYSIGEAFSGFDDIMRGVRGGKNHAEGEASLQAMKAAWVAARSPTDVTSIIGLLRTKFGLSKDQIARAFRVAANNEPLIKKMATDIASSGVGQEIYDLLKTPSLYKNNKISRDQRGVYGESITEAGDTNNGIPDSALRDIFTKVVTNPEVVGVELPPEMQQVQSQEKKTNSGDTEKLTSYYPQWKTQFTKADDNKKLDLMKSMVDKLSDHHNDIEWKKIYKNVEADLQQAGNSGNNKELYANGVAKIESGEVFENKRIKQLKSIMENKMYGRRRKV